MARTSQDNRHCTHCHNELEYKGMKEIHEGPLPHLLQRKMACDVYVCRVCRHLEFFYPGEPLDEMPRD